MIKFLRHFSGVGEAAEPEGLADEPGKHGGKMSDGMRATVPASASPLLGHRDHCRAAKLRPDSIPLRGGRTPD